MEHWVERDILKARMDETHKRMIAARQRGDWPSYYRLRRSWLSFGRLFSILVERQAEECRAQLSLFDERVGRAHDREAG